SSSLNSNSFPVHKRSNSKRCLRNDFARAKSRSVFQTQDGSTQPCSQGFSPSPASRRSSLKEMRKYTSLPPSSINILSLLIESKVKLPRYASKHLEIKRELKKMDDRAFFLDVVKDIANDLDLKSLTKKITENIAVLLDAEAASLFLIEGPKGKQALVSKVFDVPSGANFLPSHSEENEVEVPWGKGILGWVAETGETVNLDVAYEDPRYNDGVDRILGQHTNSLLCMPVRGTGEEDIIAVAQVVNKSGKECEDEYFTNEDEKLLETYLQFVGIALTNAQIMEATRREYERNRVSTFFILVIQLSSLQIEKDKVEMIWPWAKPANICSLLSTQGGCDIVFSKLFELNTPINGHNDYDTHSHRSSSGKSFDGQISCNLLKLAEQVAASGEVINIAEIVEVERGCGGNLRSLLAMPIRNRHSEIIGVATIVNKLNSMPFNEHDEQLFEAFTIFCGLGINNTLTYGELEMAIARQKVAIEVLSYHATASWKEVEAIQGREVPSADEWHLCTLTFDDFSLDRDPMVVAAVRMFLDLGLVTKFKMDYATVIRWLLTVQRNYRNVPYHNWRHAFNVAQVMFAVLTSCEMKDTFPELEVLGMFVACLCHDLDHRGTNNSFQAKTGSALALLYGTQNTMEHHHFNHAVMIINSEGHNIFSGLTSEHYSRVMNVLKQCILATDLTVYFHKRNAFFDLVKNGTYSWEDEAQREILRSMLMTASDLAASTKPWSVQRRVAELVTAEFFAQGDQERQQLQITPPASMDREREHELPILQYRWIHDICLPLYQSLAEMNPRFEVMRDGAKANMEQWEALAESITGVKSLETEDKPEDVEAEQAPGTEV
ncbi:Dual 3',5'-cyclic-AMP and -GMP phosphodiesterase 11A, partial [Orchesella cincta]